MICASGVTWRLSGDKGVRTISLERPRSETSGRGEQRESRLDPLERLRGCPV